MTTHQRHQPESHQHESHQHEAHQHDEHPAAGDGEPAMAELLDLDAEVLHEYLAELTGWVQELAGDPRRILDLGSGTGTGTFALLRQFARAEVVAVDVSASHLRHLQDRAGELGLAQRVHPVQADLDAAWPALEPVDLVWASASLHHLADPDATLPQVLAALRPGGLLVAVELDGFPRFLPDDLGRGRPGLEVRIQALLTELRAVGVPHLGDDWAARLTRAGFTVEVERDFPIDLPAPLPAATGRYARSSLGRVRAGLSDRLGADDLATLDVLLGDGPEGLLRRDDLTVRTTRSVWVARRP